MTGATADGQSPKPVQTDARLDTTLLSVREALETLDYGAVVLTVHGGKVVQLEVTRKRRFDP